MSYLNPTHNKNLGYISNNISQYDRNIVLFNRELYNYLSPLENIICCQVAPGQSAMYFYLYQDTNNKGFVIERGYLSTQHFKFDENIEDDLHNNIIEKFRDQICDVVTITHEKDLCKYINQASQKIAHNTKRGRAKTLLINPNSIHLILGKASTPDLNLNYKIGFVTDIVLDDFYYDLYYSTALPENEIVISYKGATQFDGGCVFMPYLLSDEEFNSYFGLKIFNQDYYQLIKII
ncbi:MAG: hypothetical protein PHC28_06755 [Flavobacterium sp.]|uniref:hypothetical protein n=1 Tax=Flavobacterium sp. TaxID=239 RepID=UPI0026186E4D|nr:hypothetical protein [Flavobacterium sp.]MDD5150170.1 hypothetical protein [Flavobacterium sp.]